MQDDASVTAHIVPPASWTEDDEVADSTFVDDHEWAHILGGSVQSPQWSGMNSDHRLLGCAVEIKALAATGFDVPLLQPPPVTQFNIYRL